VGKTCAKLYFDQFCRNCRGGKNWHTNIGGKIRKKILYGVKDSKNIYRWVNIEKKIINEILFLPKKNLLFYQRFTRFGGNKCGFFQGINVIKVIVGLVFLIPVTLAA